jgi:flagellar biosynthetic protein FliR
LALPRSRNKRYEAAMPPSLGWSDAVLAELSAAGIDVRAWLIGWARLLPSAILVPAFGLSALPYAARALFALTLAASVAPALPPLPARDGALLPALLAQLWIGTPVAVTAALTIWIASMAGGLLDELAQTDRFKSGLTGFDAPATPLAILFGLAASVAFLELGGPARLADALADARLPSEHALRDLAFGLAHGIQFAVAVVAPIVVLQLFVAVFRALLARATSSATAISLGDPLRQAGVLVVLSLLLDRLTAALMAWMHSALPT